ncbi:MAG: HNH endonuclease [Betaproteobacteria bacterium]|nr:HNH endonuclease [Betaproteobacteria bacterium]
MNGNPWTPSQLEQLRLLYPDSTCYEVAAAIGRSQKSVYTKAKSLGLHKSDAFLASERSGRIQRGKQHPSMIASQFRPGFIPWNKGTHFVAGGRSAETRFKAGQMPHNTSAVGDYRLNKEGHLQRKIGTTKGSNSKRWRGVAELIWCEANGPLPPKHLVVFRPGLFTNKLEEITLERIECISMAENARRNHPRSKSPELAKLVQLKGAITRQVNRIAKESQS